MNIVVLDGQMLNPGDLSWDGLQELGGCTIHDRTPREQVVSRAGNAEIVLANKAIVDRAAIAKLPKLRYLGVLATGYNNIDAGAARDRGIPVCNVPAYGTRSVAQATFALLLELTNRVGHHTGTVRAGRWVKCPDFCYWDGPLVELDGLTLGIIGFGRIGQAVAEMGRAFGMKVIAYRQPVTRAEIEAMRGGSASTVVTLQERELVKVVGRSDAVGQPLLYGTTERFLLDFGLTTLADLPPLESGSFAHLLRS